MKAEERRNQIVKQLSSGAGAVSGSTLAAQFGVSRQIIVQDITILRGAGYDILSTHNGYIIQKGVLKERVFKVYHTTEQTEEELNTIIDLGGTVVDVFVWHKVYGKVSGSLNIFSCLGVKQFIERVRTGKSTELMAITGGYHYHTIRAESEAVLDQIEKALSGKCFLAPGE